MTKTDIIEQIKNLVAAPSCYAPLKALARVAESGGHAGGKGAQREAGR